MDAYHRQTIHTWESVRSGRGMDWDLQPHVFKRYPERFAPVSLEPLPVLGDFLHYSCGVTAKKVYPGGSYALRANPSAGALYPCELYLQTRGLPGLADGIYHFEPSASRLRLLHSLAAEEGVEGYWFGSDSSFELVFLISTIYYRSSWKYGHRALRYCLLDSGHLLGAVEAAACIQNQACFSVTRFDRKQVRADFGFKNRELPMVMVACGESRTQQVVCPDIKLPFVDGSGSFVGDPVIESAFQKMGESWECRPGTAGTPYTAGPKDLAEAVLHRRSIRSFTGKSITADEFEKVLHAAAAGLAIDCDEPVQLFVVVNRVEKMELGLYSGDGHCRRSGDFSQLAGYLCLEQALGSESAATVFLVGDCGNYLPLMLKAGLVGQRIYLASTLLGLGCSGIGAFYDQEVADFLETDDPVLYTLAFGR